MPIDKLLENTCIPKEWLKDCYVDDNGNIFVPTYAKDNKLLKTGYEVYTETKKQIDICPEPKPKTLEELTKENEQLWETVQFLLQKTGMIGDEENATD